jgi:hypothetical protein
LAFPHKLAPKPGQAVGTVHTRVNRIGHVTAARVVAAIEQRLAVALALELASSMWP